MHSLPSEPEGKNKNTGVGSLHLWRIFQTQELNQGFLHCRRIFYQLSFQRSPWHSEAQSINNLETVCIPIKLDAITETLGKYVGFFIYWFKKKNNKVLDIVNIISFLTTSEQSGCSFTGIIPSYIRGEYIHPHSHNKDLSISLRIFQHCL